MKKVLKKKMWIVVAAILAVVLIGMYVPVVSGHEQMLTGLVFRCDEDGKILDTEPVKEITVEVDVNRHSFLLNDKQTLKGSIEFSTYMKKDAENGFNNVDDVDFDVESRYTKSIGDQEVAYMSIGDSIEYRALENTKSSKQYRTCTDMFYDDDTAYSAVVAYSDPEDIPVQREMKYTKNFDKMIWTDYHNQFVYVCAVGEVNVEELQVYFEADLI